MSKTVERLETTGIESAAVDEALEPVGHVLMLDYDDAHTSTVREDLETLRGPAVVVQSSPRSYHIYGLEIRPWDHVVVDLEQSRASREFVREMTRRGTATLRTGPKRRTDGEIEARAPVPIGVTLTRPGYPIEVSRPHTARLRELADDAGLEPVARQLEAIETGAVDGLEPVGELLAETTYETRTEAL